MLFVIKDKKVNKTVNWELRHGLQNGIASEDSSA